MIDFRPHRTWIGLLALSILVAAANKPVLGLAEDKAAQKLASLKSENKRAAEALRQMRDDLAAVEKMKPEIDGETAKKFLAPADRLRAARVFERRAAEAGLTHLSYTLSPEEKTPVETLGGKQTLATSRWSLTADAPTDIDAYAFLDAVSHTMPGKISLRQMSLRRIGGDDAPIGIANVRLTANGEWLSNGAETTLAERQR